ncbi:hypothetical protein HYC85_024184 [Camellia sinensis]|uniref:Increased DNA methylation 1 C-terminal domain-containing protein n=1 Tax=Camellia sinensis TaxID=4442 RepID=A0A7J7GB19_CAMSI|nr:hypothetical protein HYC85_024184 [Camellia sinensis]
MENSNGEDDPKSKCSKSQISWITTKPSMINTFLAKAQGEENTLARSILREKLGFRVSPLEHGNPRSSVTHRLPLEHQKPRSSGGYNHREVLQNRPLLEHPTPRSSVSHKLPLERQTSRSSIQHYGGNTGKVTFPLEHRNPRSSGECEKEYHVGCLRDSGLCDLKELPRDKWFCCDDYNRIHVALQNLVLVSAEMIPASVSYTIHRKHVEKGFTDGVSNDDVQWRILSRRSHYPDHLPVLSRSAAISRECFDPIVASSGRDLIPVVVCGRNILGKNFGGMYCVILIVKSVVSIGLLRIFGRKVTKLPLVATSGENQGKGYFQALFSCIESLLYSLNVENLVLPVAEEAESIWTKKLGFRKMSDERLHLHLRFRSDFEDSDRFRDSERFRSSIANVICTSESITNNEKQDVLVTKFDNGDCTSVKENILRTTDDHSDVFELSNYGIASSPYEVCISDWMSSWSNEQREVNRHHGECQSLDSGFCCYSVWNSKDHSDNGLWDSSDFLWDTD